MFYTLVKGFAIVAPVVLAVVIGMNVLGVGQPLRAIVVFAMIAAASVFVTALQVRRDTGHWLGERGRRRSAA